MKVLTNSSTIVIFSCNNDAFFLKKMNTTQPKIKKKIIIIIKEIFKDSDITVLYNPSRSGKISRALGELLNTKEKKPMP